MSRRNYLPLSMARPSGSDYTLSAPTAHTSFIGENAGGVTRQKMCQFAEKNSGERAQKMQVLIMRQNVFV
jgi:hypothetical protein